MRAIFYLALLIGAAVYGIATYVPAETKTRALAAVGLSDFFGETLPAFLRSKLTIPENPVAKRERLLRQLSATMEGIGEELGALPSPAPPTGTPVRTVPGAAPKTAPPEAVQEHIKKSRELIQESEAVLAELAETNAQQGFIARTAERLLDKILPAPISGSGAAPSEVGDEGRGVGGDSGGEAVCPPR